VSELRERLLEELLKIRLTGIDDVADGRRAAERRGACLRNRRIRCRGPERLLAIVALEHVILEVLAEEAKLPELIGHVLADVGDGAIRAHDHLLPRLYASLGIRRLAGRVVGSRFAGPVVDPHDPAALEPTLGLEEDGAGALQELERMRPEMQAEDVAFP